MCARRQSVTSMTGSEVIIHLVQVGEKLQRNLVTCLVDGLNSFLGFHDASLSDPDGIFLVTCPPSPSLMSLSLLRPCPLPPVLLLVHASLDHVMASTPCMAPCPPSTLPCFARLRALFSPYLPAEHSRRGLLSAPQTQHVSNKTHYPLCQIISFVDPLNCVNNSANVMRT